MTGAFLSVLKYDWFAPCLLYTSDAADDYGSVDLGGRRIIKKTFFQAEDGIRDTPTSRGLGDVYKRQLQDSTDNSSIDKDETSLDWQEYFSQLQDTTDALSCHIHLPVCLWIMDPHSRAPKKNTSHGNEVLPQDTTPQNPLKMFQKIHNTKKIPR